MARAPMSTPNLGEDTCGTEPQSHGCPFGSAREGSRAVLLDLLSRSYSDVSFYSWFSQTYSHNARCVLLVLASKQARTILGGHGLAFFRVRVPAGVPLSLPHFPSS